MQNDFSSCMFLIFLEEKRLISPIIQILIIHDLFSTSDKQHTILFQAGVELPVDLILCFLSEIDYHIPAYDQITVGRIRIF